MSILVSTTCAEDGTIRTFTLDGDSLAPLATSEIGEGVSAMAPDATGLRAWAGTKEPTGINQLELDPETGVWTSSGLTDTSDSMTYLTVSQDQKWLLGASYSGGFGSVWPITSDGLGEPTSTVQFANLHCVIELDGYCYFVSLGEDLIACYRLGDDGRLVPLEVPTVDAPTGSGPRHLTATPDGTNLYCVTEFGGEVIRYSRDTSSGILSQQEKVAAHATDRGLRHSELGADPVEGHLIWGADVHLAGQHLLASERTESTLSLHPVAADGRVGEQLDLAEVEKQPRAFNVTSDGRRVVVVGEKSEQISLFVLDGDTLRRADRQPNGRGANWVRFLER